MKWGEPWDPNREPPFLLPVNDGGGSTRARPTPECWCEGGSPPRQRCGGGRCSRRRPLAVTEESRPPTRRGHARCPGLCGGRRSLGVDGPSALWSIWVRVGVLAGLPAALGRLYGTLHRGDRHAQPPGWPTVAQGLRGGRSAVCRLRHPPVHFSARFLHKSCSPTPHCIRSGTHRDGASCRRFSIRIWPAG